MCNVVFVKTTFCSKEVMLTKDDDLVVHKITNGEKDGSEKEGRTLARRTALRRTLARWKEARRTVARQLCDIG